MYIYERRNKINFIHRQIHIEREGEEETERKRKKEREREREREFVCAYLKLTHLASEINRIPVMK